jgi:hypothetical protein
MRIAGSTATASAGNITTNRWYRGHFTQLSMTIVEAPITQSEPAALSVPGAGVAGIGLARERRASD